MKQNIPFTKLIMQWYRKNARDLPWRRTSDPYSIWVSEVMLQQTTVNAVIPYYQRWLKEFPTVQHVAKASEQKVLKLWQGLGYYQRAKNLHKSAQIICQEYDGKVPNTAEGLSKLPGFGPYTIGAVLSIAFDVRHPIIDANVRRVIMRIQAIEGFADTSQDKKILTFLEKALPYRHLSIFNQALMELGALICANRQAACLQCPVRTECKAYAKGVQEIIPTPKKKVIKDLHVAIGIIKNKEKYFIQKRPPKGLLADLWEFPGGKIEQGETPQQALKRELKEELDVEVILEQHVMNVQHYYTQFRVKLHVFSCQLKYNPAQDATHKWVTPRQIIKYPMPSGSAKIVEKLIKL